MSTLPPAPAPAAPALLPARAPAAPPPPPPPPPQSQPQPYSAAVAVAAAAAAVAAAPPNVASSSPPLVASSPHPHPHPRPRPPAPRPAPSTHAHPAPRPRSTHTPSHADAVLPKGSRVRITGNNRTKWDLIGRTGAVRSAQTLGGWHEVQLTDGALVRVQRNALEVLELAPPDPAALVRIESARAARPLPSLAATAGVRKRPKKLSHHRKDHSNALTAKAAGALQPAGAFANIAKLNLASLRRYRSVYNLNVSKDCSKDELVGAVRTHFEKFKVNESEVISSFLRHIARRGGPAASD